MKSFLKKIISDLILKKRGGYKNKLSSTNRAKTVLCPICDSHFSHFDSYGVVKRKNAKCNSCGSLERDRLLWKYYNEKTGFFKGGSSGRILHFAPEKVFYDFFDNMINMQYVPCDIAPERYRYNGKNSVVKVDITKIPFEDNYFDFIICNHVLEHIPDDALAMSELYRVMKKDGQGVFQVPIDYSREHTYEDFTITTLEGREKAFGQSDHVRWYGVDYKDRLEKAGFNVEVDDYINSFTPTELKKYGLMPFELIYKCSKN